MTLLGSQSSQASIFGEETAVLLQVVANQVAELEQLARSAGVAQEQRDLLIMINEGANQATQQIRSINAILERAQGVDPSSIKTLSDLNRTVSDLQYISYEVQQLAMVKLYLCDQAIQEASIQSDTAYKMGQELIDHGANLSKESEQASPGRSQQIQASASSAQMLAMGVELQTLSQISQLLAMNLELQKSQMQKKVQGDVFQRKYLKSTLSGKPMEPYGPQPLPKKKRGKS